MRQMKQAAALLLCAVLLLGRFPAVFAEEAVLSPVESEAVDSVEALEEAPWPEEPEEAPAPEEAEGEEVPEEPLAEDTEVPEEAVLPEEAEGEPEPEETVEPEDEEIELTFETLDGYYPNDALFEQYIQRLFYPDIQQVPTFNSAAPAESLSEAEYYVEQQLKAAVAEIAAGKRSSTRVYANLGSYSYEELDKRKIVYTLLKDSPLEMYWFNRTWAYGKSGTRVLFVFYAASDYAASDGETVKNDAVDAEKVATAQTAAATARSLVEKYAGYSDLERMRAYKDEICARVDYNYGAVNSSVGSMGSNPWELVYVFDDDPETGVVCEGYAKAFAYLCDQTAFNSDRINAYCVDGTVTWRNGGGGGHMWNLVTMDDGRNYIVDVTSCDSHSDKNYSFLLYAASGLYSGNSGIKVPNGDNYSYYLRTANASGVYSYSSNTVIAYPDRMLVVSAYPYGVQEKDLDFDGAMGEGDLTVLAAVIKARGEGYVDGFGDINDDGLVNGADLVALSKQIKK